MNGRARVNFRVKRGYMAIGAKPMSVWRSGRARAFGDEGREFESRSIRKGFCEFESRVYRRLFAHTARTYTAYAATHGTPSGEVASRCNPRHKGACNSVSQAVRIVVRIFPLRDANMRLDKRPKRWYA